VAIEYRTAASCGIT
jgi:hypothetical protein